MTYMIVNINEPGRYIETRDIHNLPGLVRRNVFLDGSDLTLENADISYFIDVIGRVNHMAALQKQVVARRLGKRNDRRSEGDCEHCNYCGRGIDPVLHILHRLSLVCRSEKSVSTTIEIVTIPAESSSGRL